MNHFEISVTPILTLSLNNCLCNIVTIDGVTMMFDCGWNETFSEDILRIYEQKINSKIDYVFLSNNNLNNFGALPLLHKTQKIKDSKIYATTPIAKLGFNILLDAFISKIEMSDNFNCFSDNDISSSFISVNEVKFKQNVKLTHKNSEILITPLPSGNSLGGCCWKITYKLQTILYAPCFSINFKYICDPFPYENLKNINLLITDSKFSSKIPVVKTVIENEFKKSILEDLDKGRNIFIPTDTANLNLELLIRLEKILDEYYLTKGKETIQTSGDKKDLTYKVLVCGYSSYEIVESIKALVEFLGSSISQQFYSYNENPFNLQYVQCVRDLKEYQEIKKNKNVIVLSSFDSLESGLSYNLLPEVLGDSNFRILLNSKSHKTSLVRKILRKIKDGIKIFEYEEIKRIIDPTPIQPINSTSLTVQNNVSSISPNLMQQQMINKPTSDEQQPVNIIISNKQTDLSIKKKLFAKSPYPMFSYHHKKKLNEYGIELLEKEIKLMKAAIEDKAEVFESSFKTFLYTNNKAQESLKNEMRLKMKRQDLFSKAHYEHSKKTITIQAKFSYFDLFDSNGIDLISKEIIIQELHPKDEVIFLGGVSQNSQEFYKMLTKLQSSQIKCKIIGNNQTELCKVRDNMLNIKFDSTILSTLPSFFVKDYGAVYDLKNTFLKIKTKRNEIKEISIADTNEENIDKKDKNIIDLTNKECFLDSFYTKSDIKLIHLKREITKLLNEEFYIFRNYITNAHEDFKLFLNKNELVLEGNLNPTYLKLRNCIYSNFINLDEI
jgi:Cft2 family RNA processing exonuclease